MIIETGIETTKEKVKAVKMESRVKWTKIRKTAMRMKTRTRRVMQTAMEKKKARKSNLKRKRRRRGLGASRWLKTLTMRKRMLVRSRVMKKKLSGVRRIPMKLKAILMNRRGGASWQQ